MLISDIKILTQLCDEESAAVTGGLQRSGAEAGESWEAGGKRHADSGPMDPNTTNKTNEFLEDAGTKLWEIACDASLFGVLGVCGIVADEARKG